MKKNPNIQMLEIVAIGLGNLREKMVFVGGTTTAFYITDPAAGEVRPTDDVDCIIELASVGEYHKMEKELRRLGFKNQVGTERTLICRWDFRGITVDIMPTEGTVVGFTNRWYAEGIRARKKVLLPSGVEIYVLPLDYFIGTKFEAFRGRGKGEYLFSQDIEDILTVLDGSTTAEKLLEGTLEPLQSFLKNSFLTLKTDERFEEILNAHIGSGSTGEVRSKRMKSLIEGYIL
jgi:hypothetical protein